MKFELSNKEVENWKNFQLDMEKKYSVDERYCGAAGGFYQISFTPTGIGTIVTATTIKGDERDITDWDLF